MGGQIGEESETAIVAPVSTIVSFFSTAAGVCLEASWSLVHRQMSPILDEEEAVSGGMRWDDECPCAEARVIGKKDAFEVCVVCVSFRRYVCARVCVMQLYDLSTRRGTRTPSLARLGSRASIGCEGWLPTTAVLSNIDVSGIQFVERFWTH